MIERTCLWRKRSKTFSLSCFVRYPCTWRSASPRRRVCEIVLRRKVFSRRRAQADVSLAAAGGDWPGCDKLEELCDARARRRLCQCQSRSHCLRIRLFWYVLQHRRCQRSRSAFRVPALVPTGRADGNALAKSTVAWFAATGFAPNLSGRRAIPLATDCCSGENRSFKWPRSSSSLPISSAFLLLHLLFRSLRCVFVVFEINDLSNDLSKINRVAHSIHRLSDSSLTDADGGTGSRALAAESSDDEDDCEDQLLETGRKPPPRLA